METRLECVSAAERQGTPPRHTDCRGIASGEAAAASFVRAWSISIPRPVWRNCLLSECMEVASQRDQDLVSGAGSTCVPPSARNQAEFRSVFSVRPEQLHAT